MPQQPDDKEDPDERLRARIRNLQAEVARLRRAIDDHLATLDSAAPQRPRSELDGDSNS